jgi:hypothetical protein
MRQKVQVRAKTSCRMTIPSVSSTLRSRKQSRFNYRNSTLWADSYPEFRTDPEIADRERCDSVKDQPHEEESAFILIMHVIYPLRSTYEFQYILQSVFATKTMFACLYFST